MNISAQLLNKEEKLTLALREIYEAYGYKKYKMNRFEEYGLYMNNKDFLVSESVISFTDLDGKLLALKPDVTLSIVKHYPNMQEQKLYYIENVYRPDKAKRSFCEIQQMGLERIGKIDDFAIAETLSLAAKSLNAVSNESLLEVSHMGFVFGVIRQFEIPKENIAMLLKLISGKNANGLKTFGKELNLTDEQINVLCEIPFMFGDYETVLNKAKTMPLNEECMSSLKQLGSILDILECAENICNIRIDLSLVGEEDYYNGIVFSGYVNGLFTKVLSGGQYDKILKKFAKSGGAIGFALYLNELSFILSSKSELDCDIIVYYTDKTNLKALFNYVNALTKEGNRVYTCLKDLNTEIKSSKSVLFEIDSPKEIM